ncbi:MAG: uroporphyrinogen-III C-methyltransferase [Pseudomonadota bacterium]|jgi:uroporphyrin-III C-methyltransferase
MNVLDHDRSGERPRVWLVGAGPGDPGLLTWRAHALLREATLVLHDQLIGSGVMDLLPSDCVRIDVGKRCGRHAMRQGEICALMVRLAREGHELIRLKGGDPFIFGRGGEELQALRAAGIAVQVVPGISAAQGAAAAFGLPLTQRGLAPSLVLATGHAGLDDMPADAPPLDWAALARPGRTLVFYMGLGALPTICAALQRHGLPPATPAATIEQATRPGQRLVRATLADLPQRARECGVRAPALIVIGEVVALADPALGALVPWTAAAEAVGALRGSPVRAERPDRAEPPIVRVLEAVQGRGPAHCLS